MTPEVVLFFVTGVIAIASATAMLLAQNAVHSALFLIITMICIAFLFLLLNAPFLAMVQIAVYAGAIMVLFLFVIMLLGAEKITDEDVKEYRWQTPLAFGLVTAFILMMGVAFLAGDEANPEALTSDPAHLRLANFLNLDMNFDIYVNGELAAENVPFGQVTEFQNYEPGEYSVTFNPAGLGAMLLEQPVVLEEGDNATVIASGSDPRAVRGAVVEETLTEIGAPRSGQIVIFNALDVPLSLVQINSEGSVQDRNFQSLSGLSEIAPNTASSAVVVREGVYENWALVNASYDDNPAENPLRNSNWADLYVVQRFDSFNLRRDTHQLVIVSSEALPADMASTAAARVITANLISEQTPPFGGPHVIGFELLTTYMLPFQAIAFLLLVAMIGAVVLTHKQASPARARRDVRRKVSRPITAVIAAQTGRDVLNTQTSEPTSSGD